MEHETKTSHYVRQPLERKVQVETRETRTKIEALREFARWKDMEGSLDDDG